MGYTHYWTMPDKLMDENVLEDIEKVLTRYKDIVQVEFNESGKAIVDKDVIMFNGIGDEGHETFYLAPAGQSGFCKTNGKPYDKAVCETLLVLKAHYGNDFELESDGFFVSKEDLDKGLLKGHWNEAVQDVKEFHGYEFDFEPVVDGGYYSFQIKNKEGGLVNEQLKGFYAYSGFSEPKKIADDLDELLDDVRFESNYLGDLTEKAKEDIQELKDEYESKGKAIGLYEDGRLEMGQDFQEDMKDYLYDYGVFVNPTKEEFQMFNEQKMLDKDEYIEGLFSQKDELTSFVDEQLDKSSGGEGASDLKDRIYLKRSETILDENMGVNFDRYVIEERRGLSTREVDIIVDFDNETIEGDMVAYGDWFDLETDEAIEYLDTIKQGDMIRDFTSIKENAEQVLEQEKNKHSEKQDQDLER